MKILSIALTLFTFLVISGCASTRSEYMGDKKFFDISVARMNTKPLGSVDYGESKKFKITDSSPSLEIDGSHGKYEIFHVSGTQGRPYYISAVGICDCLGRKKSVVPILYLLDKDGVVIKIGSQVNPMAQYFSGNFPKTEDYYVLIVADKNDEGRLLGRLEGDKVLVESFPLISQTTGTVFINWEKK